MIDKPADQAISAQISFYSEYVSEHKKQLFQRILKFRTRYYTVALEDIYQSQNASAVLRSCDGFGIQDVHGSRGCALAVIRRSQTADLLAVASQIHS